MSVNFIKDADADLDWVFDWSDWLATGETIAAETITVDAGLTLGTGVKAPSSSTDGKVTFWLSGGAAGTTYKVACLIETNASREDERTIRVKVLER